MFFPQVLLTLAPPHNRQQTTSWCKVWSAINRGACGFFLRNEFLYKVDLHKNRFHSNAMSVGPGGGTGNVVVWEWLNEFGRWTLYNPAVSALIETKHQINAGAVQGGAPLNLGTADPNMAHYTVDVFSMIQIRHGTGTKRNIRRSVYPGTSTAATGVTWQWMGDAPNQWGSYDIEVSDALEGANNKNIQTVDLTQLPCQLPYTVNLRMMTQTRHGSNFIRNVRRIQTATTYPWDTSNSAVTNGNHGVVGTAGTKSNEVSKRKSGRQASSAAGTKMTRQAVRNLLIAQQQPAASATFGASNAGMFPLSQLPVQAQPVMPPFGGFAQATNLPSPFASGSTTANLGTHTGLFGLVNTSTNPAVPIVITPTSTSTSSTTNGSATMATTANGAAASSNDTSAEGVLSKYVIVERKPPDDEDCCICCDSLKSTGLADTGGEEDPVFKLNKCNHMFHKSCLVAMYNSGTKNGGIQCPTCKKIYGQKTGDCPPGNMNVTRIPRPLPGYGGSHTIQITYHIPPGIQGPEHPNPGQPYSTRGFPRTGYLPDNKEGRKVLKLLRKAWDRRLTFTVGQSATTGEQGTVVWNEIHHKTELGSNHSGHGFPDPNYLNNVTMEMAVQGVTDSDDESE